MSAAARPARRSKARPCRPSRTRTGATRRCAASTSTRFATARGDGDAARTPTVLGDLETAGELVQRGQDVVHVRLDDDVRAAGRRALVARRGRRDARRARRPPPRQRARPARPLHRRELGDLERRRVRVRPGRRRPSACRCALVVENPEARRAHALAHARDRRGGRAADAARGARPRRARLPQRRARARARRRRRGRPRADAGAPPRDVPLHAPRAPRSRATRRCAGSRSASAASSARRARSRASTAPARRVRATGLYALGERQHLDLDTSQEHAAPNAVSDLAYKGALRGHARSVWRGIIKVDKGAQGTDAFQENRNLLLSGHAHADSIPGLQILANDVRCTHAATVSRVDSELLFFLMARGFERARGRADAGHGVLRRRARADREPRRARALRRRAGACARPDADCATDRLHKLRA